MAIPNVQLGAVPVQPAATGGEWETLSAAKGGWDAAKLAEACEFAREARSTGLLITVGGRILAEEYWPGSDAVNGLNASVPDGRTAEDATDIASAQKAVNAILFGIAQDRGLLTADDAVSQHIPGWTHGTSEEEQRITMLHNALPADRSRLKGVFKQERRQAGENIRLLVKKHQAELKRAMQTMGVAFLSKAIYDPNGDKEFASKFDQAAPKKKRTESYAVYLYRVLKQVHPELGISKKSMSVMNSFVADVFDRVASESSRLVRYNKRHTLSSREVQTAVRLLLPGELSRHAVAEGTKAVTKFSN